MDDSPLVYKMVLGLESAMLEDQRLSAEAKDAALLHAECYQQVLAILPEGRTFATAGYAYTRKGGALMVTPIIPTDATVESLKA